MGNNSYSIIVDISIHVNIIMTTQTDKQMWNLVHVTKERYKQTFPLKIKTAFFPRVIYVVTFYKIATKLTKLLYPRATE